MEKLKLLNEIGYEYYETSMVRQFSKPKEVKYEGKVSDPRRVDYVFDVKVSGDLRFHIHRQEYAQVRLAEEFHDKGRYNNKQKTINNITGNITAFKAVANDLGHGRIDVLGNYLGR